jgi:hypothetical protein
MGDIITIKNKYNFQMKKLFLFSILLLTFISCQDDVKFNNPSFEGKKDGEFWRAVDYKAVYVGGYLSINAYTRNETVTLKTNNVKLQVYPLGKTTVSTATYVLKNATGTVTFATGNGIGEGEIVIQEYDAVNKTVTGTFKFNAENTDNNSLAAPILNFQYGRFYKVPVTAL